MVLNVIFYWIGLGILNIAVSFFLSFFFNDDLSFCYCASCWRITLCSLALREKSSHFKDQEEMFILYSVHVTHVAHECNSLQMHACFRYDSNGNL